MLDELRASGGMEPSSAPAEVSGAASSSDPVERAESGSAAAPASEEGEGGAPTSADEKHANAPTAAKPSHVAGMGKPAWVGRRECQRRGSGASASGSEASEDDVGELGASVPNGVGAATGPGGDGAWNAVWMRVNGGSRAALRGKLPSAGVACPRVRVTCRGSSGDGEGAADTADELSRSGAPGPSSAVALAAASRAGSSCAAAGLTNVVDAARAVGADGGVQKSVADALLEEGKALVGRADGASGLERASLHVSATLRFLQAASNIERHAQQQPTDSVSAVLKAHALYAQTAELWRDGAAKSFEACDEWLGAAFSYKVAAACFSRALRTRGREQMRALLRKVCGELRDAAAAPARDGSVVLSSAARRDAEAAVLHLRCGHEALESYEKGVTLSRAMGGEDNVFADLPPLDNYATLEVAELLRHSQALLRLVEERT